MTLVIYFFESFRQRRDFAVVERLTTRIGCIILFRKEEMSRDSSVGRAVDCSVTIINRSLVRFRFARSFWLTLPIKVTFVFRCRVEYEVSLKLSTH